MSTGIHQKKAFRFQRNIGLFCCSIMNNCSMFCITCNCLKTQVKKTFLLAAKICKIICHRNLCHWYFSHIFLQPIHKLTHCNCIFYMCILNMSNFCFIFYCFQFFGRICRLYDLIGRRNTLSCPVIEYRRIQQNCLMFHSCNIFIKRIISHRLYLVCLQIFLHRGI